MKSGAGLCEAIFLFVMCGVGLMPAAGETQPVYNLLLNPQFDFHCFDNSRHARASVHSAGYVACWNTEAYGDITVSSAGHVEGLKPRLFVRNIVTIKPGKHLYQIVFLPEAGLRHSDIVSLAVWGQQKVPHSLRACVHVLKIDSQTGVWKPSDYGMSDTREFPRQARGELVKARTYTAISPEASDFQIRLENCLIPGKFEHKNESSDEQINAIALMIEFENISTDSDVRVYAPLLVKGALPGWLSSEAATPTNGHAPPMLPPAIRPMPTLYRHIPRTIRKLWRGEPLHILVMGSSIDRGSANPPLYLYNEDPQSPQFKQPLAEGLFKGELIGRPDLNSTVGRWQHYFAWAGRLRTELLRKFNYPPEKLLLNYMACDGSSVSEAIWGLEEYASLRLPPDPELNGQPAGKTWPEMYPGLFERPQGPGPDLVLFGSGANEKTDMPEEGAIFEATIRWLQAHYPDCEFIFCMWQRAREYTPNTGHLMELALHYQIPFVDMGDLMDQLLQCANRFALCPADGHPQAAGHYIWFKCLERAFEVADPLVSGLAQRHLPERLYPTAYGWEGEIVHYDAPHPRLQGNMMILDDTTVNCWGVLPENGAVLLDGEKRRDVRPSPTRNLRNSLFAYGKLSLGDRHVLELTGEGAQIKAADCKICPGRQDIPVDQPPWELRGKQPQAFASQWGAPFGDKQVRLEPGEDISVWAVGTDLALAYVDAPLGGTLKITVDDKPPVYIPTNIPYRTATGQEIYMENRRGLPHFRYGWHFVRVQAVDGPVAILGLFAYDTRSGGHERRVVGYAYPGQTIRLTPPFSCRPFVICQGGLSVRPEEISTTQILFRGQGPGAYEAIGE